MRIIIEAIIDGEARPGVLTDRGDGKLVAVFAGRIEADARRLGRIAFLQNVEDGDMQRIRAAGFGLGPGDAIHCEWSGL